VMFRFGFDRFALCVQTLRFKLSRVKKIRPSRASEFTHVQGSHGIPLPSVIQGVGEEAARFAWRVHVPKFIAPLQSVQTCLPSI
jgi:hypothetical protein